MPLNIQDVSMTVWRKKTKHGGIRQSHSVVGCIQAIIIIIWKPSLFLHPPLYYCTNVRAISWFRGCFGQRRVDLTFRTGKTQANTQRENTDSIKYTWDNKNGNNSEIASTLPWLKLLLLFYLIVIHSVFVFCIFWEGKFCILFAKVILFVVLQRLHFSFHRVKSYTEQV